MFQKNLLYIRVMDHFLGALFAQKNDEGVEQDIYYLSGTFIGAESRYNPVEKEYLALVSRRHDITWSEESFMSFQESIIYEFL